jgi:hypothetical protein
VEYELSKWAARIRPLSHDQVKSLRSAVGRVVAGKDTKICLESITSHGRAYYYGHILRPGDSVAVRVPHQDKALPYFPLCSPSFLKNLFINLSPAATVCLQRHPSARQDPWPGRS